jgi:hypothetical protein
MLGMRRLCYECTDWEETVNKYRGHGDLWMEMARNLEDVVPKVLGLHMHIVNGMPPSLQVQHPQQELPTLPHSENAP